MKTFTRRFFQPGKENINDLPDAPEHELITSVDTKKETSSITSPTFLHKWYEAFKQIWPIYFATHVAVFLIDDLAPLFRYTKPYQQIPTLPLSTLWNSWNILPHDTPHYIEIAQRGYDQIWLTAFFPLYPLLIRIATPLVDNKPVIASLLVSNLAGLVMLVVFYQLVKEDFDHVRAIRTVLYFSIFPSAFFFMAGYTETTFLCFVLLSFYHMRHGRWWLAGLCGFLAALTRNAGIFMLVPFCYEYLRQHQFHLKNLRSNVVSTTLIPLGTGTFMVYCYKLFKDPFAFQYAQTFWHHALVPPWSGLMWPIRMMLHAQGWLSFVIQRNGIELGSTFFILFLLILCLVGPWRFPRKYLAYILFAAIIWIIPLFSPIKPPNGPFPYQSLTRYMLEVFPAFIGLAALGKYRMVHYTYLLIAGALFFFLLTQFLLGYMVM